MLGFVEIVTGWFGAGVIVGEVLGEEIVVILGMLAVLPSAGSGFPTSISQRWPGSPCGGFNITGLEAALAVLLEAESGRETVTWSVACSLIAGMESVEGGFLSPSEEQATNRSDKQARMANFFMNCGWLGFKIKLWCRCEF